MPASTYGLRTAAGSTRSTSLRGARDGRQRAGGHAADGQQAKGPGAGLHLTGGLYHIGKQWAIATNTARLPSSTTPDLGLRYATQMAGKPVSLWLSVGNLADRDDWLNSYYLGAPRSVAFSAQMAF